MQFRWPWVIFKVIQLLQAFRMEFFVGLQSCSSWRDSGLPKVSCQYFANQRKFEMPLTFKAFRAKDSNNWCTTLLYQSALRRCTSPDYLVHPRYGRLCFRQRRYVGRYRYTYRYVCEQLPGANSSKVKYFSKVYVDLYSASS